MLQQQQVVTLSAVAAFCHTNMRTQYVYVIKTASYRARSGVLFRRKHGRATLR